MNKQLDDAIGRLRELPEERQQAAAFVILDFLDRDKDDMLTAEQIAEIERRLNEEDEIATDEEVKACFERFKA